MRSDDHPVLSKIAGHFPIIFRRRSSKGSSILTCPPATKLSSPWTSICTIWCILSHFSGVWELRSITLCDGAECRHLGDEWLKTIKNYDTNIYVYEERFKISFQRQREREKFLFFKVVKHVSSFVAELYPGLTLFIMNYMVVIYLYQVFKKLARLMKNA